MGDSECEQKFVAKFFTENGTDRHCSVTFSEHEMLGIWFLGRKCVCVWFYETNIDDFNHCEDDLGLCFRVWHVIFIESILWNLNAIVVYRRCLYNRFKLASATTLSLLSITTRDTIHTSIPRSLDFNRSTLFFFFIIFSSNAMQFIN